MSNTLKLFGIIILTAAVGFTMTACDDKIDGNPFVGTWSDGKTNGYKMVFTDYTYQLSSPGSSPINGSYTYTTKGNIGIFTDTARSNYKGHVIDNAKSLIFEWGNTTLYFEKASN